MKQIGSLFEKYKKILKAPQASVEKECITIIQTIMGITLKPEQVTYTPATRTMYLKLPSVLKQEIFLQQKTILSALEDSLGKENTPKVLL